MGDAGGERVVELGAEAEVGVEEVEEEVEGAVVDQVRDEPETKNIRLDGDHDDGDGDGDDGDGEDDDDDGDGDDDDDDGDGDHDDQPLELLLVGPQEAGEQGDTLASEELCTPPNLGEF